MVGGGGVFQLVHRYFDERATSAYSTVQETRICNVSFDLLARRRASRCRRRLGSDQIRRDRDNMYGDEGRRLRASRLMAVIVRVDGIRRNGETGKDAFLHLDFLYSISRIMGARHGQAQHDDAKILY